jgi:hypothetical protein
LWRVLALCFFCARGQHFREGIFSQPLAFSNPEMSLKTRVTGGG